MTTGEQSGARVAGPVGVADRLVRSARSWSRAGTVARALAPLAGLVVVQQVLFPVPSGVLLTGVVVGGRIALVAVGIALIYRANRIVNFAQGDLGGVPVMLAVLLVVTWGWSWWAGLVAGLFAAVLLGFLVETLIIRRFARAPRLVVTVATIGLAQVLTAAALLLPLAFGDVQYATRLEPPFDARLELGGTTFDGADIITLIVVPVVLVALAVFLNRSTIGIAIVGAAERADRAATLGIPVRRLHTVVWVVASLLAFVAMFLRAGTVGLPIGQVLPIDFLVAALAAAAVGGFSRFPTIVATAVGLGIVNEAMTFTYSTPAYNHALLFVFVLVGLLLAPRPGNGRIDTDTSTTWQAIREMRAVPPELAWLPEVRWARAGLWLVVAAFVLTLPLWLSTSRLHLATIIVLFGIVAASLVVLTGWAGQVSLGHMAFVGLGAAVGGALTERGWDLAVAGLVAGAVGAVAAVVVGYPALRRRGLTMAVTTLALALLVSSYVLNVFDWLPGIRIDHPTVLGIPVDNEVRLFYVTVVALVLALVMVTGLRRSRTGRVLIAIRENEPAARAFGVDATGAALGAFALSGFLAATAGALYVHQQSGLRTGPYVPQASLELFSMVVIGGLGSLPGALLGATYVHGANFFLPFEWQFLASGAGLLLILLLFPAGLGGVLANLRDGALRWVARRRRLVVPSLVADVRVQDVEDQAPPPVAGAGRAGVPGRAAMAGPSGQPGGAPGQGRGRHPGSRDDAGLLVARGVDVHYDGVQVLFGVDLDVAEGEVVALLGTNGAGKSTLLRALSGLVPPSRGSVTFAGRDVTRARPERIAAQGISQVPGGQGVFTQLSVADNLRLAGWLQRRDPRRARASTERVLETFPMLRERLADPAGNLSGGQQQMLALGMAFVGRPRALFIDELSLGLAPTVVSQLLEMVRVLQDRGTTIVLVEQSVNVALTVAERAYFMEKGEVRFEGPTAHLLERPDLLRSVFLRGGMQNKSMQVPPAGDLPEWTGLSASIPPLAPSTGSVPPNNSHRSDRRQLLPVLVVEDLTKRFGGVRALDRVSFDARREEILGFIGPNGAGKTTLFDVISGFTRADAGSIWLRPRGGEVQPLQRLPTHRRAWRGLGRSFQDGRLFSGLSVTETISVALEQHTAVRNPVAAALRLPMVGDSEQKVSTRVDELIELLGLGAYRNKFLRELSTGTRRIVDLACVLAQGPDVVLLDEPSSGIAQREAEALAPLLQGVRRELGASLLVIEHDLPLLRSIADRMVALDLGRVVAEGDPVEVIDHPRVVASYLGTDAAAIDRSGVHTSS